MSLSVLKYGGEHPLTFASTGSLGTKMNLTERLMATLCKVKSGGIIINYHTLTRSETRAQVDLLTRCFDIVSHDEMLIRIDSPGKRPFCLMTFDDGKSSDATETGDELTRLGIPAVFFVVTEFLTLGTKPLWFDRATAVIERLGAASTGIDVESLKLLPEDMRDERLDQVCARFGVDADLTDARVRPMTWEHARQLSLEGHTIGSHTRWHCTLPYESKEFAKEEIRKSIEQVSLEIGEPCRTFCFPNGNYTEELAHYATSCGVQTVMTTEPTWVSQGWERWRLPRIQLHSGQADRRRLAKICAAAFGRILKNPDGSGRAYVGINRSNRGHLRDGTHRITV